MKITMFDKVTKDITVSQITICMCLVSFFVFFIFHCNCWWDKDTPKGYSWIHFQWFCHRYPGLLFEYCWWRWISSCKALDDRIGHFCWWIWEILLSSTARETSLHISNINTKGKHGSIFKEESTGFQMCADLHKTESDTNAQHISISYLQSP